MNLKSHVILKCFMMTDADKKDYKLEKKRIKAEAKAGKSSNRVSTKLRNISEGVEIDINKTEAGSQLVISGLNDEQLNRLVPQVNKEVLI